MSDIVMCTFNARWAHASLGLRCLRAALGELRDRSTLLELTLDDRPVDAAERILALSPRVVGVGVYVWNVRQSLELVRLLTRLRPDLLVVVGGPEVSHEVASSPIAAAASHVICGEGEEAFARLARAALAGEPTGERVVHAEPVDLATVSLPYDEYTDDELVRRTVYLEASRGCPFGCEFCLSSVDRHVRRVPLARVTAELTRLWARGLRRFRFVDRTFNLSPDLSRSLLDFFVERSCPELFLHVEVVPDRMPEALLAQLSRFPAGAVQLEIGVQTVDDEVAARIGRPQSGAAALEVVRRLRARTGAHLHADLVVGLPGEELASIASGFDALLAAGPHEIQVGILKRLRGTSIGRHDAAFGMLYSEEPPYEVLSTSTLDFGTLQRLKRFARHWDVAVSAGQLPATAPLLYDGASAFHSFLSFSDWLFARTGRTSGVSLDRLGALAWAYLVQERGLEAARVRALLDEDWARGGRRPLPQAALEKAAHGEANTAEPAPRAPRQERHRR